MLDKWNLHGTEESGSTYPISGQNKPFTTGKEKGERMEKNYINIAINISFNMNHIFLKFLLKRIFCRSLLHILRQLIFGHSLNFNIPPLNFFRLSKKTEVHNCFNCTPYCYWSWFFQAC